MERLRRLTPFAAMLAAGLVGAGVALGAAFLTVGFDGDNTVTVRQVTVEQPTSRPTSFRPDRTLTIADIYKRTAPGVVQITATSTVASQNPFAPGNVPQTALGSGFVIDKAGYIVTNYHVIDGAKSIYVTFSNNTSNDAKLVGSDPSTDVAVLKVDVPASALTTLQFANSDAVQVGDSVVAIGNPFGLARTVTAGIVSAIQREITGPSEYPIDHVIQTDAPINHGNSGGPLINARGEVIGVNSQIETGGSAIEGNVAVGFAIPSNTVKTVVAQLIRSGKVEHASIGVYAQDVTPDVAKAFRLPVKSGVIVETVTPGSGAAKAGLKGGTTNRTVAGESYKLGGDIIVEANDTPVHNLLGLRDIVNTLEPGDTLTLKVYRDNQQLTVKVKLGRRPSTPSG